MKKLLSGTIFTICCLNAVAKNNEVIKLKRQGLFFCITYNLDI